MADNEFEWKIVEAQYAVEVEVWDRTHPSTAFIRHRTYLEHVGGDSYQLMFWSLGSVNDRNLNLKFVTAVDTYIIIVVRFWRKPAKISFMIPYSDTGFFGELQWFDVL